MLKFKKLELGDKALYEAFMKGKGYRQSEASFSNMFIWQEGYDTQIAADEDALYIKMTAEHGEQIFMPPYLMDRLAPIAPCIKKIEEYMLGEYGRLDVRTITTDIKEKIERECPGEYSFSYSDVDSEYVYNTADLVFLEGKKYHSKRNHINSLLKEHSFEFREYEPSMAEDCLTIHKEWDESRSIEGTKGALEEILPTKKAIEYFGSLCFEGCVIYIDGEPAAFSFGERISDDTAIIHIEKTNGRYDGLYQLINREFAANNWADTDYINRAEDMGIEGIRKAKQSYYPAFMLEKYDMVKKKK